MSERDEVVQTTEPSYGVTFSLGLVSSEERWDELVRAFRSVVGPLRGTAGCVRCRLLEDVQQPNALQLFVEWRSQEDFERHVKTDLFRRILHAMELSAESPDLQIRTIAGVRGMDLLREAMGSDDGAAPAGGWVGPEFRQSERRRTEG